MGILDKYESYLVKFKFNSDAYRKGIGCTTGWHRSVDKLNEVIDDIEAEGHEVEWVKARESSSSGSRKEKFSIEDLRNPALQPDDEE